MEAIGPQIQDGLISPQTVELLYKGGWLKEGREQLAKNMGGIPKGSIAHHMLPVIPSELTEPMELTFLKAGLDPNKAEFGIPLKKEIHDKIHGVGAAGEGWEAGGPWNFQWKEFFRLNPHATEADIRLLLKRLKGVLDDLSRNPEKTVGDLNWRYFPEE